MFPLPYQGHIQPPRSVLHTTGKGRGGQAVSGLQNSKKEARSVNGISSSWVKQTHRHGAPVAEVCVLLPRQTEGTGPPRTALENSMATKAAGTALLLASPAVVTMLRNTSQHLSLISTLLWSPCNNPLLNDKCVPSFPSCCIPLRCMRAALLPFSITPYPWCIWLHDTHPITTPLTEPTLV